MQEQHVPFDIHTYGDQVVSRFPQLNEWCPFAELVAGQPAFEVCRAMLASLQLVSGLGHMGGENGPHTLLMACLCRPMTTQWRSANSQGWKRLWIPCL